ncbi:MAG: HlyD family efflux transporter periplasmic adaptor subunit [Myxococcaceae bacterium]|nr:HlyD family efflux transporter periplasmic adaptor subunit [Myxococcaceae bacterium]
MTDPAPRLLSDIVPLLRSDLSIALKPDSPGLYEVGRRGDSRTFTMYDFEVSIARMLNGRRTVAELIESAARIGIPVSLESFQKFVRQLEAYGFLTEAEAEPPLAEDEATWVPRAEWKPEVRELFQSALRTFRKNWLVEARGYLEALLQISPEVSEAIELLARIEERIDAGDAALPQPTFEELHAPDVLASQSAAASTASAPGATSAMAAGTRPGTVGTGASAAAHVSGSLGEANGGATAGGGWPAADEESAAAPEALGDGAASVRPDASGVPSAHPDDALEPSAPSRRRRWPLAIAAGVLVLAMAGGLAVPVEVTVTAPVEISPAAPPFELTAPKDGRVGRLLVEPGAWVEPGAVVAAYEDPAVADRLKAISDELAGLEERLAVLRRRAESSAARRARAAEQKMQAEVKRLEASRAKLAKQTRVAKIRRTLAALDRKLKKARAEWERAKALLAKRSPQAAIDAAVAKAEALRTERSTLEAARAALKLDAGAAGTFAPAIQPGAAVKTGEVIARIEDPRTLAAQIDLRGVQTGRLAPGQRVTLRFGEHLAHRVEAVLTRVGTADATATVENPRRAFPSHARGEAVLPGGRRPWLTRVFAD